VPRVALADVTTSACVVAELPTVTDTGRAGFVVKVMLSDGARRSSV
jgi:hypothetical protein